MVLTASSHSSWKSSSSNANESCCWIRNRSSPFLITVLSDQRGRSSSFMFPRHTRPVTPEGDSNAIQEAFAVPITPWDSGCASRFKCALKDPEVSQLGQVGVVEDVAFRTAGWVGPSRWTYNTSRKCLLYSSDSVRSRK